MRAGPPGGSPLEALLERVMYAARWLLAPIYLGLSLAIILLGIKFFEEVIHAFPTVLSIFRRVVGDFPAADGRSAAGRYIHVAVTGRPGWQIPSSALLWQGVFCL